MLKSIKTSLIILILTCFTQTVVWADEFTRSFEFEPLHIQRDHLLKIATDIFQHVQQINGEATPFLAYIELGRDDFSTKLNFPLSQGDFDKFPDISYKGYIHISYRLGVISDVNFIVSNSSRKLVVTGTNLNHVIGLIKLVQEKVSINETFMGGDRFIVISVLIFTAVWVLILVSLISIFKLKPNNPSTSIIILLMMLAYFFIIFVTPWGKIFPGFLAWSESKSFFLEKHAPLFTFLSLVIGLLLPLVALIRRLRRPKENKESSDIESKT